MFNFGSNQILLLSCLLVVVGAGTYVTYFNQQQTLSKLNKEVEAKQEKKKEIEALQASLKEESSTNEDIRRRWQTRYKTIPDTMSSPKVIDYLTALTQNGFQRFDVKLSSTEQRDGYDVYAFTAEGEAYFASLYEFVWTMENNRPFYRINDLQLNYVENRSEGEGNEGPSMDVLVSFQMDLEAIYGVFEDGNVPSMTRGNREPQELPVFQTTQAPPIPSDVGPDPSPRVNPFYPLIFEKVPPNEERRLNVETAKLISIAGDEAVFQAADQIRRVEEGDRVYLGRITEIDGSEGRVVARLNRGGIVDNVVLTLDTQSPLQRSGNEEGQN